MNVANCDCLTPSCSRSRDCENPSKSRLPAPRTTGATDGRLDPGHEREVAALRLFLGPVRDDEERDFPRVLVAPVSSRLVGSSSGHDRADPRRHPREPLGVLAGRLGLGLIGIRPRPTEYPVVEPLAALPEPLAGPVVGSGDVPVHRRCDPSNNLAHQKSPSCSWKPAISQRPAVPPELIAAARRRWRPSTARYFAYSTSGCL